MTVKILCSGLYNRVANPNIPGETGNRNREMQTVKDYTTHTKLLRLKEKKSNWDFINILIYSLRNRT